MKNTQMEEMGEGRSTTSTTTDHWDIDEMFTVLENPTRRRILRLLSMETHYPLQIAHELGISPQAVGKHLKVLEDHGLIRAREEPSERGGPPRKSYFPTQRISMRVDMGPGFFQTFYLRRKPAGQSVPGSSRSRGQVYGKEQVNREAGEQDKGPGSGHSPKEAPTRSLRKMDVDTHTDTGRLKDIASKLRDLGDELEQIESRRTSLLNTREELLQESRRIVRDRIPDYRERRLVYYLLERGPTPLEDVSEFMDRRIKHLRELQREIEELYGLNWLFYR